MERIAVASAADQKYFPMLVECLVSVRAAWPGEGPELTLCAIGDGLSAEQVEALASHGIEHVTLNNDFDVSPAKLRGRNYLLTTLVRACLPDYFPGHDIYVWMDADSWLCDFSAMDLYLQAARAGSMGIVANFDRYTKQSFTAGGWFLKWAKIRNFYAKNAWRSGLPRKQVHELANKPCLYSGNFSLSKDAPHWQSYQRNIRQVVNKGRVFGSDQLALGMTVYLDGHPVELLPRWCNWTSVDRPKYDGATQRFVEPWLPNYPIGVMHLCGQDVMRMNRAETVAIESLDGALEQRSLRFTFDGEAVVSDHAAGDA